MLLHGTTKMQGCLLLGQDLAYPTYLHEALHRLLCNELENLGPYTEAVFFLKLEQL